MTEIRQDYQGKAQSIFQQAPYFEAEQSTMSFTEVGTLDEQKVLGQQ